MKIWITVEKQDYNGCEIHLRKPKLAQHSWQASPHWTSKGNRRSYCKFGTIPIKAVMNLTDWPNLNEVMEYDTETEEGIITNGEVE